MSLYSALPPAQGQALTTAATSTPAAAATAASSRVTPPRFIPLRPSMPSIPRALLNRPTQLSKPHPPPPPSTSAVPSPTHQPILPSSTQLLLAELEAADDGDDGDEELQLALDTLPDVYQPRKPNEWQQYVEWKEQKEAAQAEAEAEESRKRAAEQLNEATVDDDTQHSKRQQRSFHYAYKSSADHEESVPSEKSQTAAATLPSPPPAALVAAPLADKQAMLAVASGEDAYMRRMKMSSQSTTAINAATDAASHQHRHPSPPTISLPRITLPLPPPPPARPAQPSTTPLPSTTTQSRVILLTVAYYCLLTQQCTHSSPHAPLCPFSRPAVAPLGCVR